MLRPEAFTLPLALALLACAPKPVEDPPRSPAPEPAPPAAPPEPPASSAPPVASAPPPVPPVPATCDAASAPACVAAARALDREGEVAQVIALLEKACDAGDGEGCRRFADAVRDGHGVPQSSTRAAALEDKACGLGDGIACALVGDRFGTGAGAYPDKAKAEVAWRRAVERLDAACAGGAHESCIRLAFLVREGRGTAADAARIEALERSAVALQTKACDAGDGDACLTLATALRFGKGVTKDVTLAVAKLDRGCELRSARSCFDLGIVLRGNSGVPADPERGKRALERQISLLDKPCAARSLRACGSISLSLSMALADPGRADAYDRKVCELGNGLTCKTLARRLASSDRKASDAMWAQALARFQESCAAGDGNDCGWLGLAYLSGDGTRPDPKKGMEALLRGCALADAGSCLNAAGILAEGEHKQRKDKARARDLFEKACALGRKPACEKAGK